MSSSFFQPRRDQSRKDNGIEIKSVGTSQKPACIVQVYGFVDTNETKLSALNLGKVAERTSDATGKKVTTINNDIVKCTIHKNKNSSSGGFSLILKRGNKESGDITSGKPIDYLKVLSPGDWITIYMRKDDVIIEGSNSKDSGLKMLGIIENVRYLEVDDPATGKPRFEYVVTGRDFGKIFESEIYFNPLINSIKDINNVMGGDFSTYAQNVLKKRSAQSADEVAKSFISYFLADKNKSPLTRNTAVFRLPTSLLPVFGGRDKFSDILDYSFIGLQKFTTVNQAGGKQVTTLKETKPLLGNTYVTSFPPSGTVWSFLKSYSNPALNEMIVDLANKDGKIVPTFQLRQIPLSHSSSDQTNVFTYNGSSSVQSSVNDGQKTLFRELPQHVIKSTQIKQKNIGKSDFERVNSIVVVPQVPSSQGQEIKQAYLMMFNSPSVKKYGQRLLRLNTIYTQGEDFKSITRKHTELVTDFFMLAHTFYNGTVITDGTNDFVQVGQNLYIEDVKQLFHIDGISYMYEIDQDTGTTTYNTEFRVSHGQKLINGKLDFIGRQYKAGDEAESNDLETLDYATIQSNTLENIRNTK